MHIMARIRVEKQYREQQKHLIMRLTKHSVKTMLVENGMLYVINTKEINIKLKTVKYLTKAKKVKKIKIKIKIKK